jgi:hypothetical protein
MRPELGAARRQFAVVPQSGDNKVAERGPVSQVLGRLAWPGQPVCTPGLNVLPEKGKEQ